MNATIYSHRQIIGHADLKVGDETMGHIYGIFEATDHYQSIQNVVRKFNSANERDYSEWISLELCVQLSNGYFLFPFGGIEIDDLEEFPSEPRRIDIAGVDTEVIIDYFKGNPPESFTLEPWITLDIDRKLAFEQELGKEISVSHLLANCDCSALCTSLQSDDVLFAIQSEGYVSEKYALVHLTWSNQKEGNPKFPITKLFSSFEEFKEKRMFPDKIDFEL